VPLKSICPMRMETNTLQCSYVIQYTAIHYHTLQQTLQYTIIHCNSNTLQRSATLCNTLHHRFRSHGAAEIYWSHQNGNQHTATIYCNNSQYTATHCTATHCTATLHDALQHHLLHSASLCNSLRHSAARNALQPSATLCNTIQYWHCSALQYTAK